MSLTLAERETIILFNEADAAAAIYTYNERLKAQIAEYARQNPDKTGKNTLDESGALHYELPKSDLRILLKKPRSENSSRRRGIMCEKHAKGSVFPQAQRDRRHRAPLMVS